MAALYLEPYLIVADGSLHTFLPDSSSNIFFGNIGVLAGVVGGGGGGGVTGVT